MRVSRVESGDDTRGTEREAVGIACSSSAAISRETFSRLGRLTVGRASTSLSSASPTRCRVAMLISPFPCYPYLPRWYTNTRGMSTLTTPFSVSCVPFWIIARYIIDTTAPSSVQCGGDVLGEQTERVERKHVCRLK